MPEVLIVDRPGHIPPKNIHRNIRQVLETHLVLKDLTPDLADGLIRVAGKPDFDFKGIDSLLDEFMVPSGEDGGDKENAN